MLIKRLIGISFFLLFFVCPVAAQSSSPQQNIIKPFPKQERTTTSGGPTKTGQYQKKPTNLQGTANKPATSVTEIKPVVENNTSKARYDYEAANLKVQRQLSKSTKTIAYFTIFLVIVTAVLAGVAMWQGWFAKKSLTSTQRAFVFVEDISTEEPPFARPDRRPKCKIIVTLKNSGLTPTKHMICNINYASFNRDEQISTFRDRQELIYGLIGPKASFRGLSIEIPTYDLVEPALLEERMCIWGWVDYNDIFSKHRHRTEFCYEVIPKGSDVGFRFYGKYNGAEDECYRKPSPYTPPT